MSQGFFITGTDTGVGKTTFAYHLLTQLKERGYSSTALKPLSSGCDQTMDGLRNPDALLLQKASTIQLPYDSLNPFAFELPIAPHIAAHNLGIELSVDKIMKACERGLNSSANYIIIEGAGGFAVPLNSRETTADLAKAFGFPIILVVGLRLGCLNQSLLTYEAIQKTGLTLAGWLGNLIENNMMELEANIAFLKETLKSPFLGIYPQCYLDELLVKVQA